MLRRLFLMAHEPQNIGASVRAKLLNKARAERADFQILLTRYALERLLYRLSLSDHRDEFVLKGAMLFVAWVADPFRPTRDLDLLGRGDNGSDAIAAVFRHICAQPVADDGVTFDIVGLQVATIADDREYSGVRVRTTAVIAGARVPIQVDVGFGDAVTPQPIEIDYPTLLDHPAPHLKAYPVETVVAEKFEALVTLGIANTRMKDFYDLWLIAQTFEFRQAVLAQAVLRTFGRLETRLPVGVPVGLTEEFAETRSIQWRAFLGRDRMAAAPLALAVTIGDLRGFLMPLVMASDLNHIWPPGGPWSSVVRSTV
jgi:hypothetical protein